MEDLFQVEWDALIAAAQEEGELQLYACCGGPALGDFSLFEEKYDVRVVTSTGSGNDQVQRVAAERDAGRYTLDVFIAGNTTLNRHLQPAGFVTDVRTQLIHPEVLDPLAWFGDNGPVFMDAEQRIGLAHAGNARNRGEYGYNTNLVDPERDGIASYWDLLDPKWNGKMVAVDPRTPAVGGVLLFWYLHPDLGPDFLEKLLTETGMDFTSDSRLASDDAAVGAYHICAFGCSEFRNMEREGLPVTRDSPVPIEGPRISVGGSVLSAIDRPPNPNAQKLFINWWHTQEGQEFFECMQGPGEGSNSLRWDTTKTCPDPEAVLHRGRTYVAPEFQPNYADLFNEGRDFINQVMEASGQ
jgi:ABC-type Fe3+ transport system substrate-binding protein